MPTSSSRHSVLNSDSHQIQSSSHEKKNGDLLAELYEIILKNYYVEVDENVLLNGALKELQQKLGPKNFQIKENNKKSLIIAFNNSNFPNVSSLGLD